VTVLPILFYVLIRSIFYPNDQDHPTLPATT